MSPVNRLAILQLVTVFSAVVLECSALDTGTVAPIDPVALAGEKVLEKDAKKIDRLDIDPEFYKGPNSNSFDLKYNGNNNRPSVSNFNGYLNPYLSKHGFYGQHDKFAAKDRVSIGGGSYSSSEFNGNGYDRVRPYGSPQPIDLPPNAAQYEPPYDTRNPEWGGGGGGGVGGGIGGGGNQNGYGYGYGNMWTDKMHNLSKSHFLPLAGAALIGIAAALLVNPVWLQLGTVAGKRRRRDTSSHRSHVAETHAHDMAYDGQRPDPK